MPKSHARSAEFRTILRLFQLFGHPIRVIIFQRLASHPMGAGELAKMLPVSRTAIVQNLKQLEAVGLVQAAALGRKKIYRIEWKGLAPLQRWIDALGPTAGLPRNA